ncbi:MAG: SIMPL domain-containing protein [Bdellovibrionales bacterium]|nr:SIMPL domain-containing protein [Bdellovibrionales bacterium]
MNRTLLPACLLALLLLSNSAHAQSPAVGRHTETSGSLPRDITVSAEARSRSAATTALLTVNVESTGKSASEAAAAAESREQAIRLAVSKLLPKASISSRGVTMENAATRGAPLNSSSAVHTERHLGIETEELTLVPKLIDACLQAGAAGVEVDFFKPTSGPSDKAAAAQAVERAKEKAEAIAVALGMQLGAPLSLTVTEEPPAELLRRQMQQGKDISRTTERYVDLFATVRFELLPKQ